MPHPYFCVWEIIIIELFEYLDAQGDKAESLNLKP